MTTAFANSRDSGNLMSGEHLTGNMDFYVFNTTVALDTVDFAASNAAKNLIRVGEIIGIQAQPVMTGLHVIADADLATYLGAGHSGTATIYQLKFAIEHAGAWNTADVTGTVVGTLAHALANETALCALPSGAAFTFGSSGNSMLTVSVIL